MFESSEDSCMFDDNPLAEFRTSSNETSVISEMLTAAEVETIYSCTT